jgi:N-acetylglucosamine-6-sulfatase
MYVMAEWNSKENKVRHKWYGRKESDYLTDVIAKKSVKFIQDHRQDGKKDPLFLYVASTAPHAPMTSAPRHRDKLEYWDKRFDEFVSSRPNYHSNLSVSTKSSWLKNNSNERDELLNTVPYYHKKEPLNVHKLEWRRRMSSYYSLDDMVKSIHDELREKNELDNTVFILVSDNGFNLGAHKLSHKMTGYEESVRIPMYFSGKSFKAGAKDMKLALLNDITPTILDILGYIQPDHMDGQSLTSSKRRKSVLLEYGKRKKTEKYTGGMEVISEFKMITDIAPKSLAFDVHPYIAIRTDDFMLINYYNMTEFEQSEYELYNMKRDPYQIRNVINELRYRHDVSQLKSRLEKLSTCYGKECNYI